jgi:hypothetical protein
MKFRFPPAHGGLDNAQVTKHAAAFSTTRSRLFDSDQALSASSLSLSLSSVVGVSPRQFSA